MRQRGYPRADSGYGDCCDHRYRYRLRTGIAHSIWRYYIPMVRGQLAPYSGQYFHQQQYLYRDRDYSWVYCYGIGACGFLYDPVSGYHRHAFRLRVGITDRYGRYFFRMVGRQHTVCGG
jgi:hypothetical protein